MPSTDLHGMTKARAEAEVRHFLMRHRGHSQVKIITGRGHGNRAMTPVLREHIRKWVQANREDLEVQQVEVDKSSKGGALIVHLCKRS